MTAALACRICGNVTGHAEFSCQEKMLGRGERFRYFQCRNCRCLQAAEVPPDLGRYYPPEYYSFNLESVRLRGWEAWRHGRRDYWMLTGKGWLGPRIAKARAPRPDVASLRRAGVTPKTRILDVGCGRGQLLGVLWRAGFHRVAGVDPFLGADHEITPGLRVRCCALPELAGQFDLIMMHHAFEHLVEPEAALSACRQRLGAWGRVLLRFPTVDSDAWERYRENWVDLDAPRHLFLHSRRSLELLAARCGFAVDDWWCDSDGFQFWASELYRKGVPLQDAKGVPVRPEDHFRPEVLRRFEEEAAALNARGRGDQVAVVLSVDKTPNSAALAQDP
jgi:SAM-dependent methyltransferase